MDKNKYLENLLSKDNRLNNGTYCALLNYKESIRHNSDEYEITELPYKDEDYFDFVETLRKAEIMTAIITAKCVDIIDALFVFKDLKCTILRLDRVTRIDTEHNVMGEYKRNGIRIKL